MAGLGKRFSEAGYKLPKPLINVSGVPMIVKVIRDLPPARKWIFVIRREHLDYGVDVIIKKEIPDAIFLVDENPIGQASSCLVARDYLETDEELFIASCDNGFLYDSMKFENLKNREDVDFIAWTFTQRKTLERNPCSWGWYNVGEGGEIEDISVKVPISDNPFYDHAVVASFYFKRARDFVKSVEMMIEQDYKVNNEFYVDAVPKFLKQMGKKCVIFDVDLYVGWGKPDDLHDYERVEFVVKNNLVLGDLEEKNLLELWKKYFEK